MHERKRGRSREYKELITEGSVLQNNVQRIQKAKGTHRQGEKKRVNTKV